MCAGDRALPAGDQFRRVELMFQHGELAESQVTAARLAKQYQASDPEWSEKFSLLEAESAAWRGMSQNVLEILGDEARGSADPAMQIGKMSLMAVANIHLHRYSDADFYLERTRAICANTNQEACSKLINARASMATERGQFDKAQQLYQQSLALSREFHQPFDEATDLNNLGATYLQEDRYDEAIDWLNAANRMAVALDAQDLLLTGAGNLGWAYYNLGDGERALGLFQDAERRAIVLGDNEDAIDWLTASAYVFQDDHDFSRAAESYGEALQLAKGIKQGPN